MRRHAAFLPLLLSACAATPAEPAQPAPRPDAASTPAEANGDAALEQALSEATQGVDDAALQALLREHWAYRLERNPLDATRHGIHIYDDRIADGSAAAIAADRQKRRDFLARAEAVDSKSLSSRDRVTQRLFVRDMKGAIASEVCDFQQWTVSPRSNPVTRWNYLPRLHKVKTELDGQNLLARYRQIPKAIDDRIALLRQGIARELFTNAESTRRVIDMVKKQLAQPIDEWPLMLPAKEEHADWPAEARAAFGDALRSVVEKDIKPALERYGALLKGEILPKARPEERSGLVALPIGEQCYAALVRSYTTLDAITPQQIHDTGLKEIERIDAEFKVLGKKLFRTRNLKRILGKLRTDPELHFATSQQVEDTATQALADAKAAMGASFGILPKADCIVSRIPDYEAPYTTIAYYREPHPDGSKPGEYFINVIEPKTRPRYEARVLAFHESIPGHHLQIAISQELPAVPAFRKHGGNTVFVEGWALYTERLSDEMGLYRDDLDRMGMLSFDAWRAGRLVVDTGIHALGWSRSKAKQFLMDHTALAANNVDNEVDRYIVWPGQAVAYKIGQLEIWKLRREAEKALGDAFDIKAFHDAVLGGGAVSLPILREQVHNYVAAGAK